HLQPQLALDRSAPVLTWAPVEVLADEPTKIEERGTSAIAERLVLETARVERELRLEMAYLSLRRPALEQLGALVARGVRVHVLTNALATTDVVFAHAGYVGTRWRLLAAGVELSELRPGGHERGRVLMPPLGSRASLHSKAAVFDERAVYVGSLNLDPRSIRLNTEIGLLVESPGLAREVARRFDAIASLESSWRVELRTREIERRGTRFEVRELAWVGLKSDGTERVWRHEPRAGLWRRSVARILSWLPIEGLI
ncbi:MAG: phospholipase D family protein, partial [Thermoanaerobaculia bacterium]